MARQAMSRTEIDVGVRQRSRNAFGLLFDQEANGLFHAIQSQGHSCLTAEDIDEIVSDAFRSLWKRLEGPITDDFNSCWYLRWIANKRVISRIRAADGPKAALQRTSLGDPRDPPDTNALPPDHGLLTKECIIALDAAMMALTEREFSAIEWYRDHNPPDWASFEAATGIPAKTGRKLAVGAKVKLKHALDNSEDKTKEKGGGAHGTRKRHTA